MDWESRELTECKGAQRTLSADGDMLHLDCVVVIQLHTFAKPLILKYMLYVGNTLVKMKQ